MAVVFVGVTFWAVASEWLSADTNSGNVRTVRLEQGTYRLEVVQEQADQVRGLSGRPGLPDKRGMLFEYQDTGERCMWMEDMRFSLDILWIDADKRIVRVERNVGPETYPRTYCSEAQYVIELDAGEAAQNGLRLGSQLAF